MEEDFEFEIETLSTVDFLPMQPVVQPAPPVVVPPPPLPAFVPPPKPAPVIRQPIRPPSVAPVKKPDIVDDQATEISDAILIPLVGGVIFLVAIVVVVLR